MTMTMLCSKIFRSISYIKYLRMFLLITNWMRDIESVLSDMVVLLARRKKRLCKLNRSGNFHEELTVLKIMYDCYGNVRHKLKPPQESSVAVIKTCFPVNLFASNFVSFLRFSLYIIYISQYLREHAYSDSIQNRTINCNIIRLKSVCSVTTKPQNNVH